MVSAAVMDVILRRLADNVVSKAVIQELERTVKTLADQAKTLSLNATGSTHPILAQPSQTHVSRTEFACSRPPNSSTIKCEHTACQLTRPKLCLYTTVAVLFSNRSGRSSHITWYPPAIAAPLASHLATIPQSPPAQEPTPLSMKPEQRDEAYLSVLQRAMSFGQNPLVSKNIPEKFRLTPCLHVDYKNALRRALRGPSQSGRNQG
jgi:hypothetical protein